MDVHERNPDELNRDDLGEPEEDDEVEFEDVDEETPTTADTVTLTREELQAEIDRTIRRFTAKERSNFEKSLKDAFGTTDMRQAAEYYQAGRAVAQQAGVSPGVVLQRLAGGMSRQAVGGQATQTGGVPVGSGVEKELSEIRTLIAADRFAKVREVETTDAKRTYGPLYDRYSEDIQELADERGLSLVDAGAIVLRPHLQSATAERLKRQSETQRRRKVEAADAPPKTDSSDIRAKLSSRQLEVAKKMGVSPRDYYNQLKELGDIP